MRRCLAATLSCSRVQRVSRVVWRALATIARTARTKPRVAIVSSVQTIATETSRPFAATELIAIAKVTKAHAAIMVACRSLRDETSGRSRRRIDIASTAERATDGRSVKCETNALGPRGLLLEPWGASTGTG